MRWLIALFAALVVASSAWADETTRVDRLPGHPFANLHDALVFIDHGLDASDWQGLTHILYPSFDGEPNRTSWKQLKAERGSSRLAEIFSHEHFPSEPSETIDIDGAPTDTFEVGASNQAHASFAGWSRIRFIRLHPGEWYLYAVYGVR